MFGNALYCALIQHGATVGVGIQQKAQAVTDVDMFAEKLLTKVPCTWKLQHIGRFKRVQHRITGNGQQRRVCKFNEPLQCTGRYTIDTHLAVNAQKTF